MFFLDNLILNVLFTVPEGSQRKPRARTPKVEKLKIVAEVGVATSRKRKKSVKVDVKETSDVSGEAGPPAELDSVTDTIEAVLANAATFNTTGEKLKKAKRVKKQDQEGNVAKTPKHDAGAAADENDDDSSTAGTEEG